MPCLLTAYFGVAELASARALWNNDCTENTRSTAAEKLEQDNFRLHFALIFCTISIVIFMNSSAVCSPRPVQRVTVLV